MKKVFGLKKTGISSAKYYLAVFPILWLWIMYILGGCETIAGFWQGGIENKIGIGFVGILISLSLIYVVGRRLEWKVPDFSWKEYREKLKKRYHLNKIDVIILVVAVLVGGGIRVAGYDWGITSIFQPDEGNLVTPAIGMAMSGCLYQKNYYYPSQFLSKFAAILISIYGRCTDTELNGVLPQAYFIFRIITAISGTVTIFVCFLIGNYIKKHFGAILAVLVSVYPLYVLLAKQVTGDVSVFLFLSITMLFSLRYMEERKNIFLLFMSMGAALATLEKWHGAVGIGYTGVIILLNSKQIKEVLCRGILAIGAYVTWIMALSPNVIFNIRTAIVDGFINIAVYDGSTKSVSWLQMVMNYGKFGIDRCGGMVYLCCIIIGFVYIIRNFVKEYLILLMGILKVIILSLLNRQYNRWGFELYFCQLFLAAMGIELLIHYIRKCRIVWYGVFALITIEFMTGSMVYVTYAVHSENDTRLIQENECISAGITMDNSVSAYYTGFSPGGINSKTGMCLHQRLSEYFFIENGELYKNAETIEYAVVNLSINGEPELVEAIQRDGILLFSYDAKRSGLNFVNSQVYLDDIKLIRQNIDSVFDLYAGALSGSDIEVYDVSNVPLAVD